MINIGTHTQVFLAAGVTDMRKSIDGLSVLVINVLEADPLSSHLFVFCNRLRDKIKILYSAIAPALLYLLHPCSRGTTMVSGCFTVGWNANDSGGRLRVNNRPSRSATGSWAGCWKAWISPISRRIKGPIFH